MSDTNPNTHDNNRAKAAEDADAGHEREALP
jgi:hypothetical protein